MQREKIEGKQVRLSPRSITVINADTGKTAGVVRAEAFTSLPPRRVFELHAKVDRCGLRGYLKYVYVDGANMYYLNNTRKIASLRDSAKAFEKIGMLEAAEKDNKKAEQLAAVAKNAADNGIPVINCDMVNCFDI